MNVHPVVRRVVQPDVVDPRSPLQPAQQVLHRIRHHPRVFQLHPPDNAERPLGLPHHLGHHVEMPVHRGRVQHLDQLPDRMILGVGVAVFLRQLPQQLLLHCREGPPHRLPARLVELPAHRHRHRVLGVQQVRKPAVHPLQFAEVRRILGPRGRRHHRFEGRDPLGGRDCPAQQDFFPLVQQDLDRRQRPLPVGLPHLPGDLGFIVPALQAVLGLGLQNVEGQLPGRRVESPQVDRRRHVVTGGQLAGRLHRVGQLGVEARRIGRHERVALLQLDVQRAVRAGDLVLVLARFLGADGGQFHRLQQVIDVLGRNEGDRRRGEPVEIDHHPHRLSAGHPLQVIHPCQASSQRFRQFRTPRRFKRGDRLPHQPLKARRRQGDQRHFLLSPRTPRIRQGRQEGQRDNQPGHCTHGENPHRIGKPSVATAEIPDVPQPTGPGVAENLFPELQPESRALSLPTRFASPRRRRLLKVSNPNPVPRISRGRQTARRGTNPRNRAQSGRQPHRPARPGPRTLSVRPSQFTGQALNKRLKLPRSSSAFDESRPSE